MHAPGRRVRIHAERVGSTQPYIEDERFFRGEDVDHEEMVDAEELHFLSCDV
jgi:hypothetical protein